MEDLVRKAILEGGHPKEAYLYHLKFMKTSKKLLTLK